jgi:hypothetical protein
MTRRRGAVVASARKKLRRDGMMEAYLGLCFGMPEVHLGLRYGLWNPQQASRRDDAFDAYLSRWSEVRRG